MAEHKQGKMDISDQERTFEYFVRWTGRIVIAILVILVLLALINA